MAALLLDDGCAGALRHRQLCVWRDHLVLADNQIPAWLPLPGRLADRAVQRFQPTRYLGIGHERGLFIGCDFHSLVAGAFSESVA